MESMTNNDFLNSVLESEAWKEVSSRESFSMEMIEKFADKLDWEEVSGNQSILWTVDGISKYANKIHWEDFSNSCPDNIITETTLNKFSGKWDWKCLSNRDALYNNWSLLEKFADKVNWGEIITNWNIEKPVEFFARFQQYIPMSKLQDSSLWRAMVEARSKRLCKKQSVSINAIGLSLWKLMSNSQTIRINGREVLRELPDLLVSHCG